MISKKEIKNLVLNNEQYAELLPIQEEVFKAAYEDDQLLLLSPTGSGKTLSFLLFILSQLKINQNHSQALIISPTRELAIQIQDVFKSLQSPFTVITLYGGHSFQKEKAKLKNNYDLVIATPGRLCDHLQRKTISLHAVFAWVIDEYDKCLELGFEKEIKIIRHQIPKVKKQLFTSATSISTFPNYLHFNTYKSINHLDNRQPELAIHKVSFTENKDELVVQLLQFLAKEKTILFCNFKADVERLSEYFQKAKLPFTSFMGDYDQQEREKALLQFENGSAQILLATDLAARGIDIDGIQHIVHYQIPPKEKEFTHRNGRTARMNKSGHVYIFHHPNKEIPQYLPTEILEFDFEKNSVCPKPIYQTIILSAGKEHKISKGDVLGFLIKVGQLAMEDIGKIHIKDSNSYAAIKREKVTQVEKHCQRQKLKKTKVKITAI